MEQVGVRKKLKVPTRLTNQFASPTSFLAGAGSLPARQAVRTGSELKLRIFLTLGILVHLRHFKLSYNYTALR